MYLLSDVVSNWKGNIYGRKGDQVKVIAKSVPAVIVESMSGERFSTKVSNLSESPVKKEPVHEQIIVKKDFQKRTKTTSLPQKQLF